MERALNSGKARPQVILSCGQGDLQDSGHFRHHGSAHDEYTFIVHPKHPELKKKGLWTWLPGRDTLLPGRTFCTTAKKIRTRADGCEVWQCGGHDVGFEGEAPPTDFPAALASRPLTGKRLVEVFAGDPSDGGAGLSDAWMEAGGEAIKYDWVIDPAMDFMTDESFWARELEHPADMYHFAISCTRLARHGGHTPRHRIWKPGQAHLHYIRRC